MPHAWLWAAFASSSILVRIPRHGDTFRRGDRARHCAGRGVHVVPACHAQQCPGESGAGEEPADSEANPWRRFLLRCSRCRDPDQLGASCTKKHISQVALNSGTDSSPSPTLDLCGFPVGFPRTHLWLRALRSELEASPAPRVCP